jgi:hypothetical protein
MNRRKAIIGWLVYSAAKPIAKRFVQQKAKAVVPAHRSKSRIAAISAGAVAAAAAVGGALFFWRRKSDAGEPSTES